MARFFLATGALLGGSGVMAGAFASHALRTQLAAAALTTFETAARYQLTHALALLIAGLLLYSLQDDASGDGEAKRPSQPAQNCLHLSGLALIVGILLFCGSLYGLSLGAFRNLGWVTPLGGLSLIAGWFALAIAAVKLPSA